MTRSSRIQDVVLHIGRFSGKLISISFYITQEKVKAVFDNLIQLEHLNIVKFHKYWADVKENRARVRNVTTAKKMCYLWVFIFSNHKIFFVTPFRLFSSQSTCLLGA